MSCEEMINYPVLPRNLHVECECPVTLCGVQNIAHKMGHIKGIRQNYFLYIGKSEGVKCRCWYSKIVFQLRYFIDIRV